MYFQKAIISHPSLSFAMINKTSSFMPALQEQFSPFRPGACSTRAQVWILKHEWTEFPDNILPIVLANSMNIFPFLKGTSLTWFILRLLVPFCVQVTFYPWLHPAADQPFSVCFFFYCALMRNTTLQHKFMVFWPRGWNTPPLSLVTFRRWFSERGAQDRWDN